MRSGLWEWAMAEKLLVGCAFALGVAHYAVNLKMLPRFLPG